MTRNAKWQNGEVGLAAPAFEQHDHEVGKEKDEFFGGSQLRIEFFNTKAAFEESRLFYHPHDRVRGACGDVAGVEKVTGENPENGHLA